MEFENEMTPEQDTSRICRGCGQVLTSEAKFCPICGSAVAEEQSGASAPHRGVTKKEYRKHFAPAELYKQLKSYAIWGYVLVGINVAVALLFDAAALLDALLQLGLVLGIHLKRSKGCAIGLLVYTILMNVLYLIAMGSIGGIGWLIISIGSLRIFGKMDKAYEAWRNGLN